MLWVARCTARVPPLDNTRHTPKQNNTTGGKPPRVSNVMKMGKNILYEFEWDNWPENASGKANLRDVQTSKRCVSAQRFCSAAISLKSTGSAANCFSGLRQGAGEKISNDIFQTWQIQKLYIEFLSRHQTAMSGRNGNRNTGQGGN
jgi:hypothetical protein